jgi:hypothetical protein
VNHLATGSAASGSTVKNDPPHSGSAAVNGHGSITIDPPHNEVHFNFAPVLDGSAASLVTGRAAGNNTSSFQHAGANSGYPDSSQNWLVSNGEHSNLIALANNDRSDHQSTAAGYDAALGPPSGVGPASGHDAQLHLGGFIIH